MAVTHLIRYRETKTSGLTYLQTDQGRGFNAVVETLLEDGFTCAEIEGVIALHETDGSDGRWEDVSCAVADALAEAVKEADCFDGLSIGVTLFLHNASRYVGNGKRTADANAEHRLTGADYGIVTGRRAA